MPHSYRQSHGADFHRSHFSRATNSHGSLHNRNSSSRTASAPDLSLILPQLNSAGCRDSNSNNYGVQLFAAAVDSNRPSRTLLGVESPLFEQPRVAAFSYSSFGNNRRNPEAPSYVLPGVSSLSRGDQARAVRVGDWTPTTYQLQRPNNNTEFPNAENLEVSVREVFPTPQFSTSQYTPSQFPSSQFPSSHVHPQVHGGSVSPIRLRRSRNGQYSPPSLPSAYNRLLESFECQVNSSSSSRQLGQWYRNSGNSSSTSNNGLSHRGERSDVPYLLPSLSSSISPSTTTPSSFQLWQPAREFQHLSDSSQSISAQSSSSNDQQPAFTFSYEPALRRHHRIPAEPPMPQQPRGMGLQELRKVSIVGAFEGLIPTEACSRGCLFKSSALSTRVMGDSERDCDKGNKSVYLDIEDEGDLKRVCTICCATFLPGEPVRAIYRCGHRYHVSCIDRWFEDNTTCPICRSDLKRAQAGSMYTDDMIWEDEGRTSFPLAAAERRNGDSRDENYRETTGSSDEAEISSDATSSEMTTTTMGRQERSRADAAELGPSVVGRTAIGRTIVGTPEVEIIEHHHSGRSTQAVTIIEEQTTRSETIRNGRELDGSNEAEREETPNNSNSNNQQTVIQQQPKPLSSGSSKKLKFFFSRSSTSPAAKTINNATADPQQQAHHPSRPTTILQKFFRSLSFKQR